MLDFRKGKDIDGLEVVLTSRAASVTGGVVDENGLPAPLDLKLTIQR